jgi:hypothetical protein
VILCVLVLDVRRPPFDHRGFVTTRDDRAVAAGHRVEPVRWLGMFDDLMGRIAARFPRVEPRRRAGAFVLGLLADLPGKELLDHR